MGTKHDRLNNTIHYS